MNDQPNAAPEPVSKKKKGMSVVFTLLVLVGAAAFLGAVATPKFLKFGCKSKQSEAKTNLHGLFTSQKAFFGEYEVFTTDLVALNWRPDGSPIYAYGFSAPSEPRSIKGIEEHDPTRRTTLDARVLALGGYSASKTVKSNGEPLSEADFPQELRSTATTTGFLALAVGDIDSDGVVDAWSIDEKKHLDILTNDCTR